MEAMRVRRQRRRHPPDARGGHLGSATTSSGFTVDLWEERRAHPTWDHYGGVMLRRAPHGSLPPASVVATSCLCPRGPGAPPRQRPTRGTPTREIILTEIGDADPPRRRGPRSGGADPPCREGPRNLTEIGGAGGGVCTTTRRAAPGARCSQGPAPPLGRSPSRPTTSRPCTSRLRIGACPHAAVAVIIAFLQWKTAQTKLALDIHATRYAIYQDLREAVTMFLKDLKFSNEVQAKYWDAQSRARFYFGAEVEQYLERLRHDPWSHV
jgi:hypothetical protein